MNALHIYHKFIPILTESHRESFGSLCEQIYEEYRFNETFGAYVSNSRNNIGSKYKECELVPAILEERLGFCCDPRIYPIFQASQDRN